ncbi:MAG: glutamine--fructose-6-phosphate transaminase (isomerizing) [Dehalococcoidia bacterium]|nr:MAG: glutamine--fructose-6-phosphate transaminase (isomerizing) [Dehalococcoidia bacterium]
MCGIVGYIGERAAQPVLINCLKRLEYRGYDSCGIALLGGYTEIYKDAVRIEALEKSLQPNDSVIGIGHTRWATHGKPSEVNAHPHSDCSGKIAVVHNGVIENYMQLREQLTGEGHVFSSETDTEVIPHLIEKYYDRNLEQAVSRALNEITGSYAFITIHADSGELILSRKDSPLIIGIGDGEYFVASDVPAVLDYTDRVIYLEDGDLAAITKQGISITNNNERVTRVEDRVPWTVEEAQKAGYEHFMIKEIHEQPKVIRNTFAGHISALESEVELGLKNKEMGFSNILILACGTSYHAALIGKHVIQKLTQVPVTVDIASEFNYSESVLGNTLVMVITQSGETADCMKALKKAKELGCYTLVITNVVGSSAARIADDVLYIKAGPEISVAATKSFVAQLVMLYLFALSRSSIDVRSRASLIAELRQLPNKIHEILNREEDIAEQGRYLAGYENAFFVARGISYPVALEGALKVKEIAYIHAEGYAAGELKHGPFALLTPETPVIAIATRDNTYETILANIKEIKARESPVVAIAEDGDDEIGKYVDAVIRIPSVDPLFAPTTAVVALHLLAYYTAKERGCSIDMPRNLAKSVTVE